MRNKRLKTRKTKISGETIILKGAVSSPIDFKKIWEGNGLYLWEPIAPSGFIALGVVFTKSLQKPNKDRYCCVARDFLLETKYKEEPDFSYTNTNSPLTLWSGNNNSMHT